MLHRMGFGGKLLVWMCNLLQSSSIFGLVNGSPTEEFLAQKGLRQGDLLAPFLFLVVAEGLCRLVREAKARGPFPIIDIGNGNLKIPFLQFGTMPFFLLQRGHDGNHHLKSNSLVFWVGIEVKSELLQKLLGGNQCRSCKGLELHCHDGFLCLHGPTSRGDAWKISTWQPITDKMRKKLTPWRRRHLSVGGRIWLVNLMLSSLSLYYLSLWFQRRFLEF